MWVSVGRNVVNCIFKVFVICYRIEGHQFICQHENIHQSRVSVPMTCYCVYGGWTSISDWLGVLSLSFHSYCHRENKYSFALPPPTVGQKGTSAFVHMLNFSREHWYTSHHDYKLLFAHSAKQHLRQCQIIILVLCLRYSQSSEWRHWLLRTNKKLLKLLRWWAKWRLWSNVNNSNDWFITDNVNSPLSSTVLKQRVL